MCKKRSEKIFLIGPLFDLNELSWAIPPHSEEDLLDKSSVIFVDGGLDAFLKLNLPRPKNSVSIGDGDSSEHAMTYPLDKAKDFSDFSAALDLVRFKSSSGSEFNAIWMADHLPIEIYCLGFLGGRLDHQLFVLGELFQFLKRHPHQPLHVRLSQELSAFPALQGPLEFNFDSVFSVFSMVPMNLSIHGKVDYLAQNQLVPPLSSLTLSNRARGAFTVQTTEAFFLIRV